MLLIEERQNLGSSESELSMKCFSPNSYRSSPERLRRDRLVAISVDIPESETEAVSMNQFTVFVSNRNITA